ncbi:flagellar filament capping protein FliD [Thiorhodovibrio frisius]|uniref:Flagellar hook-associated protein 2 n=1 Tax=Thiorhodovibrio frisius TaxID=631362 RepID=H8Z5B2_9GAMM|nr:flagellar filament capping protein FliD [Thiorhodovibrio frisius]EIC20519.1 flagellar capping protein [Thiorhodovibrio frisius]WPL21263.1 Flagellar cap protein [Thiorhodovibrio frisius]
MAISSLGVGSGLDLSSLLQNLVAAERAPTENRLNKQEATLQAKISAYGTLRGGLSSLESPLKRLSEFEPKQSVTNSDKTALTVKADADAPSGNYKIDVNRLAAAQSLATNEADAASFTDKAETTVVNEGDTATLSLQVGSGTATEINLDASEGALTLGDVRDAINGAEAGVTASIINDDNGSRLVLTSDETGADNTIKMTASGTSGFDIALSIDGQAAGSGAGEITQVAQDAEAVINGITITSSSNSLDDAVDGLSVTLNAVTESTASVTVAEDKSSLRSLLNEFVGAYNELINQTNSMTAYNADNQQGALLMGDSTVRGIRSMLGNSMVQFGQTNDGENLALANLGIVSGKDGKLSFDQDVFNDAMDSYGSDNIAAAVKGFTGNFYDTVTSFTDSSDGMLAARTDGLRTTIDDIAQQREDLDERMLSLEERLSAQFAAMDSLVAQMNNTSNYLATQLGNLISGGSK